MFFFLILRLNLSYIFVMRLHILLFLGITLLFSCQIDIRQVPAPREFGIPKVTKVKDPVFIGRFDIYSADRMDYVRIWRASFLSYIKSNRIFSDAFDASKEKAIEPNAYILDISISPKLNDTYNYWITWPAIYPMSGYWPLQIRKAKYDVYINYTLFKGTQIVAQGKVEETGSEDVTFYGFYRTSSFERMIEVTNLMVMEKCIKDIESAL